MVEAVDDFLQTRFRHRVFGILGDLSEDVVSQSGEILGRLTFCLLQNVIILVIYLSYVGRIFENFQTSKLVKNLCKILMYRQNKINKLLRIYGVRIGLEKRER